MEKGKSSSLFANDGSFMERFKQLEQEKGAALEGSKQGQTGSDTSTPKPLINKSSFGSKANDSRKTNPVSASGKLAFSLKQKSKLVAPALKLSDDEDEEDKYTGNASGNGLAKRQKLGQLDASQQSQKQADVAPPPPSDSTVKEVADRLANFVAKHGRSIEHITRQKNPGDTPFKFLFDESCADYKYYEYQLGQEEKALSESRESQASQSGSCTNIHTYLYIFIFRRSGGASTAAPVPTSGSQKSDQQHSNYQTPASALYDSSESSGPTGADPIAMMEFYMKKAAREEKRRQPKQSKDEMPPPASLQAASLKKGHHMGDYIPQEELEKFLASCNDAAALKAAKETAEKAKIQADNVGHKLLSKMGWKEGEGLGSSKSGIADPIMAGNVKKDHLGVGAHQPGEVTPEDDIYEQYKKRMMLGYKFRPNPLGNPRKSYY
ncbi:hypothetical protein RHGRI_001193 [Rhododendron griersonianum]|nr:hypothetical protein RHGRI_001193 [Rhododendron griersonianum]